MLNRRGVLAGGMALPFTKSLKVSAEPGILTPPAKMPLAVMVESDIVTLLPAPARPSQILALTPSSGGESLRLRVGEETELSVTNRFNEPFSLYIRGYRGQIDGKPHMGGTILLPVAGETRLRLKPDFPATLLLQPDLTAPGLNDISLGTVMIIEEAQRSAFDRDTHVVFKDLRLESNGQIAPTNRARLGNALALNGRLEPVDILLSRHERLRLRLANASSARILAIEVHDFSPTIIALDGEACEPMPPLNGQIILAPGSRVDLLVEFSAPPTDVARLTTRFGPLQLELVRLFVRSEPPLRQLPLPDFNGVTRGESVVKLDLAKALRVKLLPGQAGWRKEHNPPSNEPPLFQAQIGKTIVIEIENRRDVPFVFHLEGHHVRPLDSLDDGVKPWVLDTVLFEPGERLHLAFTATRRGIFALHTRFLGHPFDGYLGAYRIG